MTTGEVPFADLLRQARDGDPAALEQLARTYEKDVRIAARVLLGPALRPHLDSLDLVQSVHRTLLLGLRQDKFDVSSPAKLVALAMTIVRRKVARKWREHRRQSRLSSPSAPTEALHDVLATLRSTEDDPSRAAQVRDAVDRLCGGLDADDRQLLELRLDGWTTAEAARRMGQNPDVLRVRLSRLRKQLHEHGVLSEWL
jgi:RNA polymerase sigma-70 factor (ECF subfamily)